jgi:hypothetical protein
VPKGGRGWLFIETGVKGRVVGRRVALNFDGTTNHC